MKFITFQPNDWRKAKRTENWTDIYWEELGYNPVWCIPAESLMQAYVNGLLACPTTPEKAIFFKADNFRMISKEQHYRYLDIKKKEERSVLLSSIEFRDFLREKNCKKSVRSILLEAAPYKYEYLVHPEKMNIIAEVNIEECINKNFSSPEAIAECKNVINSKIETARAEFSENNQPDWLTEERTVRNAVANIRWRWYLEDNDFFIDDYKKYFGNRLEDPNITTAKLDPDMLDDLISKFDEAPSDKSMKALLDYLDLVMFIR